MAIHLARQLLDEGRYRESVAQYARELSSQPANPALLAEIGLLSSMLGDFDGALDLWKQGLRADPHNGHLNRQLASLLKWKGRLHLALSHAEKALAAAGESPVLCGLLSAIHAAMGAEQKARHFAGRSAALEPPGLLGAERLIAESGVPATLRAALADAPLSRLASMTLGAALLQSGALSDACRHFRHAIFLHPGDDAAYLQLGITLQMLGRAMEAVACLKAATVLSPANPEAWSRLGVALLDSGRSAEGLVALEKAMHLRPDWHVPLRYAASAFLQTGRHAEALRTLRRALALHPGDAALHSLWLATLHYLPTDNPRERFEEFRRFADRFETPLLAAQSAGRNQAQNNLEPGQPDRHSSPGRRIRVGYVSGDFRRHSVAFFIEPVLRAHDRQRFEVFCYMTRSENDAVTQRLRSLSEHWREVAGLRDDGLADCIRADRIDILVDLSNHTAGNRLLVFARRPAPVQMTMIGLHQSTGLRSMDYRITDAILDPPGGDEELGSEKLIRLESGPLVFLPPDEAPPVNALPALAGGSFVLGCTNDLEKVTPEVRSLWAGVLRALPAARLLFFGRSGNSFIREMGECGIPPERFIEEERKNLGGFLEVHHRIDLALDPFPYNGLTVSLLSAYMGVPCVSLRGNVPPARAAASVLQRIGLAELVADSPEEYLRIVVRLAENLPRLAGIRAGLRERVIHAMGDAARHVRELEDAYETVLTMKRP